MASVLYVFLFLLSGFSEAASTAFALKIHHHAQEIFIQDLKKMGVDSLYFRLDQQETRNLGGARKSGNSGEISIGRDSFAQLTDSDFLFTYCHELGHFLGGAPKKPNSWASTESQADYWSTRKCLTALLPNLTNEQYVNQVQDLALRFFDRLRIEIGPEAANLAFYQRPQPELRESKVFESEYASFQCRFDTLMAGARNEPRPRCLGGLFHGH